MIKVFNSEPLNDGPYPINITIIYALFGYLYKVKLMTFSKEIEEIKTYINDVFNSIFLDVTENLLKKKKSDLLESIVLNTDILDPSNKNILLKYSVAYHDKKIDEFPLTLYNSDQNIKIFIGKKHNKLKEIEEKKEKIKIENLNKIIKISHKDSEDIFFLIASNPNEKTIKQIHKSIKIEKPTHLVALATHLGLRRVNNEDSGFILSIKGIPKENQILIAGVADGVGGLQAGEYASSITVKEFIKNLINSYIAQETLTLALPDLIHESIKEANNQIIELKNQNKISNGATTLTTSVIIPSAQNYYVGHVGDSRLYHINFKKPEIIQVTKDHKQSPTSHVITRAIGVRENEGGDVYGPYNFDTNEILLISSDGLTDLINGTEIFQILATQEQLTLNTITMLINLALSRGGKDNITVAAIQNIA